MQEADPKIVSVNRLNREFWSAQQARTEAALADETVLMVALEVIASESARSIPVHNQMTFEAALTAAERAKRLFLSQQGRKGRRARRADPLQALIVEIVGQRP